MYDLSEILTTKGIHIAHLNIRSLVNKWEIFKAQFMRSNLHFIGLSETWLNTKLPDEMLKLSNEYTLIRNDRNWSDENGNEPKKGGGIACYIKNDLKFSHMDYSHWNTSSKDIESQWISLQFPNSKPIIIGNIYRPPQGSIDGFTHVLDNIFTEIDLSKVELYLIGDMNVDMIDKQNEAYRKLIELTKPIGLRQLIKQPTRYSNARDSILDICFTNCDFIQKSGVCDINISDHQMILLTRKKKLKQKNKCTFTGRSYRNYSKNEFQDRVINADWYNFRKETTVEGKWKKLIAIIEDSINVSCPLKNFKIKQVKEPWITAPLIELIKDKDIAIKQAKKRKDPLLWENAKRLRNACTNRLRKARADYIKENLENNAGNSKNFGKIYRKLYQARKIKLQPQLTYVIWKLIKAFHQRKRQTISTTFL